MCMAKILVLLRMIVFLNMCELKFKVFILFDFLVAFGTQLPPMHQQQRYSEMLFKEYFASFSLTVKTQPS